MSHTACSYEKIFTPDRFSETQCNGEGVKRKWSLYRAFFFFHEWMNLSQKIANREKSSEHRTNYLTRKDSEQRRIKVDGVDVDI
jgi:hypothetical protein